jgi:PKD repeat protein
MEETMNEINNFRLNKLILAMLAIAAISLVGIYPALAAPPGNDDILTPTVISGLPFSDYIDTSEATVAADDPWPSCNYWGVREATVWYQFTPTADVVVMASTAGSNYQTNLAVYAGDVTSEVACTVWSNQAGFQAAAGQTYLIMIAAMGGTPYPGGSYGGLLNFTLDVAPPPVAQFDIWSDPWWGLRVYNFYNNSYDPAGQGMSAFWDFGDGNTSMDWYSSHQYLADGTYWVTLTVTTSDGRSATTQRQLDILTPPPVADFYPSPGDPSTFDTVNFNNWSQDPACYYCGMSAYWDFGDGTTSTDWSPYHRYAAEGDYTVSLTVTTQDGRTASTTRTLQVRTHDVAITKFTVPQSAKAGQTRSVSVYVNNTRYPEQVEVQLFKSTPAGWQWVGTLQQEVPVRPSNRTTIFEFSYTFTAEDAQLGRINFRAVATIVNARDALPTNNEAISLPTKVAP